MDNHTQRIAAVREAVQAQDSWVERYLSRPACEIIRPRLAADLEHLDRHAEAEAHHADSSAKMESGYIAPCGTLATLRARTEEIARLLGLAQGGGE